MSGPHEFLSPDWIEAALALRDEYAGHLPEPPAAVLMNLVITDVPHSDDGQVAASINTAESGLLPQLGHLENPELSVRLDYDTARKLFLEQDPEAVGRAFFEGRIAIDGDMSRLFFLQSLEPTEDQRTLAHEVQERLTALTA